MESNRQVAIMGQGSVRAYVQNRIDGDKAAEESQ